jgi:UDP-N-acetylmuramyl pentapeptide phosphotransferase/UDP-N-acetylglucosamine-1-phosphate transferase
MSHLTATYAIAFAGTLLASLALVLTKRWHGRFSLDGAVGVQKMHTQPTPRVGGVAIVLGLVAAYSPAAPDVQAILGPILLAGIPAFVAGLLEDIIKKVGVLPRLLATMLSGVLAWYLTGIAMQNTGAPPLDWLLTYLPLAVVFTAFAVSGVANAINIIDGFNGLAAGTVAILLGTMGVMSLQLGDAPLANVCFVVVAVALGFGAINWPLGKLFLGDGGAYLLGFIVGWVAVLLPMRHPEINAWATLLVCAYPVLEVAFSVRRRGKREGHHPGQPDKAHLHHFIHRRLLPLLMPRWVPSGIPNLRNGFTSPFCWLFAALPATWAVVFAQNTPLLILGLGLAVLGYGALYARLTQFGWCCRALTMRQPVSTKV